MMSMFFSNLCSPFTRIFLMRSDYLRGSIRFSLNIVSFEDVVCELHVYPGNCCMCIRYVIECRNQCSGPLHRPVVTLTPL